MKDALTSTLKNLPDKPGVYQYFNANDQRIYIGKAKSLKKRVRSYFNRTLDSAKTKILVKQICRIEYIVVKTELDALILENSLIKKHQPKYNILLKDDKTFPWICIKNERFPRVFSTRKIIKDGSKYYGPYPNTKIMRTILEMLHKLFSLRTCTYDLSEKHILKKKYSACLEYQIKKCKAPCEHKQSLEDYIEDIEKVKHILKGNIAPVKKVLEQEMLKASDALKFEKAGQIKEKIELLKNYQSKSTLVSPTIQNVDVVYIQKQDKLAAVNYMRVHHGAVIYAQTIDVKIPMHQEVKEMYPGVIMHLREKFQSLASEVICPEKIEFDMGFKITNPIKGDKKALLDLAEKNTKYFLLDKKKKQSLIDPNRHTNRILETLKKDLKLKQTPVHIECFDNSNHAGTDAVAACVVFKNAKPSKKDYRHFLIKTVKGPDDFASMQEVVFRRYKRLIQENKELPQLIVVDGGKGQLSSAVESLKQLSIFGKVAIIGIAKKLEEIYFPNDSLPLYIDKRSESLKLIQQLRNEAHRFGIEHHRNIKTKRIRQSTLTEIKGIGDKTKQSLLRHFKSVDRIKKAELKELEVLLGKAKAHKVFSAFKSD